jgi:leucyl aminopeptidase
MVDLATLTGGRSIIAALAHEYAGLFNGDDLAAKLTAAAPPVAMPSVALPLGSVYDKMIDSPIADMKCGRPRRRSITAAQFLQRYIDKGTPWAHLDIAGTVWPTGRAPPGTRAPPAMARLLDAFVRDSEG